MGFRKEKAVKEIRIGLTVQTVDHTANPPTQEEVLVGYVFKMPTTKQLERHNSEVVKLRRRSVKTYVSNANWNLFRSTIIYVEGYDDLPGREEQTLEILTEYFNADVVRMHVDGAVMALLEHISIEEADWEKK